MTDYGDNCPLGSVVASVSDCQDAASHFVETYGVSSSWREAPAGCWFNDDMVHFNTITDPSLTSPKSFVRGICLPGGT